MKLPVPFPSISPSGQLLAGLYLILSLFGVCACSDYQPQHFTKQKLDYIPPTTITRLFNTDSVLATLTAYPSIQAQLDSLFTWTDQLSFSHKEIGLTYANEAYQLSVKKGYRFAQALAMLYRAELKGGGSIFGERKIDALTDALIAKNLIQKTDDPMWQKEVYGLLGFLYKEIREDEHHVDSAHYYLNMALESLTESTLPPEDIAYHRGILYEDLANIYRYTDSLKLIEFYNRSIAEAEISENKGLQAIVWRGLGLYYSEKYDYPKADSALKKSEVYALEANSPTILVDLYQFLADLHGKQYEDFKDTADYNASMEYLRKCLSYKQENQYYTYLLIAYNFRDKYYARYGRPPTQYHPDADSAIWYYKLSLLEAQKVGALDMMKYQVDNINELCGSKQRLTPSTCFALLDSLPYNQFLNENYAALIDTIREEVQRSNLRLRNHEQGILMETNRQRVQTNWLISGSGLVFAGLIFLVLYQNQQKKRLEARMEALRAQINPHFISNSLNAIENLVNSDQREAASKYLIHFSRLSRKILNSSRGPITSLEDELQMLEHYMALEQLRFRDKLSYTIEIAPELNPRQIEVPALILQPYVENAIIHGIKPKLEPGNITIRAQKQGKYLECTIEDDGIGREKAAQLKAQSVLPKTHTSQGMKITEERLKMAGNISGQKVHIEDLVDEQGQACGTRIHLLLPLKIRKN